jgi:hypothetical protein
MAAGDQFTGVEQFVGFVNFVAQQGLHAVEHHTLDQRLMATLPPMAVPFDVTDVRAVAQDAMDLASGPFGLFCGVIAFGTMEFVQHHVDRAVLIGVQVEDVANIVGFAGFDGDYAAAIDPLANVSIWSDGREPPSLTRLCP